MGLNQYLFECLCSDLGVTCTTSWSYTELNSLKDRLLQLTEGQFPYYATDSYLDDFRQVFPDQVPAITPSSLRDPHSGDFKRAYQLLCWGLKIHKPHTKQQEEDYVKKFLQIEEDNRAYRVDRACPVSRFARSLCRRTFANLDLGYSAIARWCRHGPGATFDREVGSDKNVFILPPSQLLAYAPWDAFFPNASWAADESLSTCHAVKRSEQLLAQKWADNGWFDEVSFSRKRFLEARLTLVPKTFKGPRGVFISSKEAMFWQLAQDTALKRFCEGTWIGRCYCPKSQEPSKALAYKGSYSRWSATLDLSDASDRVPLSLVAFLFHRADYLSLARTRPCYVWLPNGERHKLSMFGPMGDGKTFPILTIICLILSVSAIAIAIAGESAEPTNELVARACRSVRVFGDDIIVPTEYYDSVVKCLQSHNLKVNESKSFSKGYFRESCGMDAYHGVDVTPIRQKVDLDNDTCDADESFEALVDLHNRALIRGLRRLSGALFGIITKRWHGKVGLTTDHRSNPHALLILGQPRKACQSTCKGSCCDYSRCMWCGSAGLISRVELLHVHWRLNTDIQRIEQLTLVPEPINYGFEGNSWWNCAYALWPKQQIYPEFATRKGSLGSKVEWNLWKSACRAMHIRDNRSIGGGLCLQWVPLV